MNVLKEAFRSWRHRKMLAFFSFVVLSVGIGANAAVFSWIYRVLSDPFSLESSDRLVLMGEADKKASLPNFDDWQRLNTSFESMAAFRPRDAVLQAGDRESVIRIAEVTADFFRVLRIEPELGRVFAAHDTDAAVLSHGLWKSRFSGNPGIVGRRVSLDQKRPVVVGVMPPSDPIPPLEAMEREMTPVHSSSRSLYLPTTLVLWVSPWSLVAASRPAINPAANPSPL